LATERRLNTTRMGTEKLNMKRGEDLDIYSRLSRNRRRLALAYGLLAAAVMAMSAAWLYMFYGTLGAGFPLWATILLFWLFYLAYAIVAYALSGRFILSRLRDLHLGAADPRLENALVAMKLAAGFTPPVHLRVIDHPDINSFSLSLPDGSYLLFATRGVAEKLGPREREAILAHELGHMEAGDTLIYTLLMRMQGGITRRDDAGTGVSISVGGRSWLVSNLSGILLLLWLLMVAMSYLSELEWVSGAAFTVVSIFFLFLLLASIFPLFMYTFLRLLLDKEREYAADMRAVFLTRDPGAVYAALRNAAEDVRDVMLLPAALDALLFHPVVDYTSYRPLQTQPTMAERMQRLRLAFPLLAAGEGEAP